MPPVKKAKSEAELVAAAAVLAAIEAKVHADPRGAPITIHTEPAPPLPTCALDDAPIHSKIVVVDLDAKAVPIFSTPERMIELAADDIGRTLPRGAKVQKMGVALFVARQLDSVQDIPDLVTSTATAAIQRFRAHFHGQRD